MQEFNMGKLLEKKELAAIAIVFFAVAGLLNFPARASLPEFSEAMLVQDALSGAAVPIHTQVAAQLLPIYSSFIGISPSSPDAIVALLLMLPPLLLALSAVFIYLTLRVAGHRRTVSAFFSLLVSFLLSSQFLPGVYGAAQLATTIFSLFLLHITMHSTGRKPFAIAIAALFAAASAFIYPSSALVGIAVCLPLAVSGISPSGKVSGRVLLLLPFAAFAAGALLPHTASTLGVSIANFQSAFFQFSFLLAFASLPVALYAIARPAESKHAISALLGLVSFAACPPCAALALAIPAASGLEAASNGSLSKSAKLLCAFVFGFFAIFAIVYSGGDAIRATAMAFMVAILFPLLMHFYDYQNGQGFSILSLCALAFAIFLFASAQFTPGTFGHVYYSDSGFSSALSSIFGTGVQGGTVYLIGNEKMAEFYLPSGSLGNQTDLISFLAEGKPMPASGSYLLLSPSYLESGSWPEEGTAFSAYQFNSNISASDGSAYAVFASISGGVLRPLDTSGGFALRDGSLLDSSGRQYYTIPYSRMMMLRSDVPFNSFANRLIIVGDGSVPPYFLKIYSGKADGVAKVRDFGSLSLYKVD
ncbi:MAG: hypothetical protein WCT52_04460 [Candidatus Micrarchaeia archaeon]